MSELDTQGINRVVLIVDDEPDCRDCISTLLYFLGYSTLLAPDRDRALDILEETVPDAMILDWQMPGMGIEEFLEKVRAMETQPEIVLLSAHQKARDKAQALGLKHFLPKPFDMEVLGRKLRDCMGGGLKACS